MFDRMFTQTVIQRRIPVAVYSEVKKRVMTEGQEFALNCVNDKIRESTTGRRSSSRSSSSGAKKQWFNSQYNKCQSQTYSQE